MNDYRKFNRSMCVLVISIIAIICTINLVVDPYGIWKLWTRQSVNVYKTEQETHERLLKSADIINIKPGIVFLGTSRTRMGLDPAYYFQIQQQPIYNAAVSSANMNEILWLFKHAVKNQPALKQVILGIDFYVFNEYLPNRPDFPIHQMEKEQLTFRSFVETTLSYDALKSSLKTVGNNYGKTAYSSFETNGKSSETRLINTYGKIEDVEGFTRTSTESYVKYEISQERMNDFREIVNICREKNIDLRVFISPSHSTDMEAIRVLGKWDDFENMKRLLCSITPIWDFSGYNSITTEPISNARQYYWDSSHYRKPVGNMILERISSIEDISIPDDFGLIIQPENIEEHLEVIRKARESWAYKNPSIVQHVQSMKQ